MTPEQRKHFEYVRDVMHGDEEKIIKRNMNLQMNLAGIRTDFEEATQRTWVGLTDEEIWESDSYKVAITDQETRWLYRFAKEIEAKLKEKNT